MVGIAFCNDPISFFILYPAFNYPFFLFIGQALKILFEYIIIITTIIKDYCSFGYALTSKYADPIYSALIFINFIEIQGSNPPITSWIY